MNIRDGMICAALHALGGGALFCAGLSGGRGVQIFLGLILLALAAGQGALILLAVRGGGERVVNLDGAASLLLGAAMVSIGWSGQSVFYVVCGLVWLGMGTCWIWRAVRSILEDQRQE